MISQQFHGNISNINYRMYSFGIGDSEQVSTIADTATTTTPQCDNSIVRAPANTTLTSTVKTTTTTAADIRSIGKGSNTKLDKTHIKNNNIGARFEARTPLTLLPQEHDIIHPQDTNHVVNDINNNATKFRSNFSPTCISTNSTDTEPAATDLYYTIVEPQNHNVENNPNSDMKSIQYRRNWESTTLALPDIDDTSMKHTLIYLEHYKIGLGYSMLSDTFFVLGSILCIILSIWDYKLYYSNQNDNSNNGNAVNDSVDISYYNAEEGNNDQIGDTMNYCYVAIDILAPCIYLINSIIDMYWAEEARKQARDKQNLTRIWDEARYQLRGTSFTSTNCEFNTEPEVQQCYGCDWLCRFRKYAAHRRTMMAASTFGIAAALAVLATFIRNFHNIIHASTIHAQQQKDDVDDLDIRSIRSWFVHSDLLLDGLSDHVYIVSAIFSMTGKRYRPLLSSSSERVIPILYDSERLEDLGDVLFFIGSLMDIALTEFSLKHLVMLPIISSISWLIDGCLYMRSEIVKASKLRDETKASTALMNTNNASDYNHNTVTLTAKTANIDENPPIKFVV